MKRIHCILFAVAVLLSAACSDKEPQLSAEQQALSTAETLYEALYDGDYNTFLDGRIHASEMPESYRKALITNFKQYVAKAKSQHGGVSAIKGSRAQMDTLLHIMQVYLLLHYKDSVTEEIVVPMVDDDGTWKMK